MNSNAHVRKEWNRTLVKQVLGLHLGVLFLRYRMVCSMKFSSFFLFFFAHVHIHIYTRKSTVCVMSDAKDQNIHSELISATNMNLQSFNYILLHNEATSDAPLIRSVS